MNDATLRLLTVVRKRGIFLTLNKTGTLEIGNFKALTVSEKQAIDVHLDEIIAYLTAHPPLAPQPQAPPPTTTEPSATSQEHSDAAEVSPLRSLILRTSPQSTTTLRATLFGIAKERVRRERRRALG